VSEFIEGIFALIKAIPRQHIPYYFALFTLSVRQFSFNAIY